jgi:hypothetical protein
VGETTLSRPVRRRRSAALHRSLLELETLALCHLGPERAFSRTRFPSPLLPTSRGEHAASGGAQVTSMLFKPQAELPFKLAEVMLGTGDRETVGFVAQLYAAAVKHRRDWHFATNQLIFTVRVHAAALVSYRRAEEVVRQGVQRLEHAPPLTGKTHAVGVSCNQGLTVVDTMGFGKPPARKQTQGSSKIGS